MSRRRFSGLLVATTVAAFITALDNTAANVALPHIQQDLLLSQPGLEWVAAVYPLTFATLLLLGGHSADVRGHHSTLLTGMAVFTAASLLCALATDGAVLITGRGLQGVGAALVVPASLAVVTHDLAPELRNAAVGTMTAALAAALALGPVISGVITQHLGWRWIFVLNLPLGFLALVLTAVTAGGRRPRTTDGEPEDPGDRSSAVAGAGLSGSLGVTLSCLSLAGCAYCLIEGQRYGFGSPRITAVLVVSLCALALAVVHRLTARMRRPRIGLLRHRAFVGGIVTQLLWGLGVNGVFFFTSQFLQNVLRLTPTVAGLAFCPVAMCLLLATPLVQATTRGRGGRLVAAAGLLMVAIGLLLVSRVGEGAGVIDLMPGFAAIGTGSAMAVPLTTRALEAAPHRASGTAAGLFSAAREASGVLGIAVIGAIVAWRQHSAASGGANPTGAFLEGYHAGLTAAAVLVAAGVPVAWWALAEEPGTSGESGSALKERAPSSSCRPPSSRRRSRRAPR